MSRNEVYRNLRKLGIRVAVIEVVILADSLLILPLADYELIRYAELISRSTDPQLRALRDMFMTEKLVRCQMGLA